MASVHAYTAGELPAPYYPHGTAWMQWRLGQMGYTNPKAWLDPDDGFFYLRIDENNISKNQLAVDVLPADGRLNCSHAILNVAPSFSTPITITGPVGKTVKARFDGIGFVMETSFVIPGGGYQFVLGPCPIGMAVVTPQMYDFYVEDGSCSPVAVLVTFK